MSSASPSRVPTASASRVLPPAVNSSFSSRASAFASSRPIEVMAVRVPPQNRYQNDGYSMLKAIMVAASGLESLPSGGRKASSSARAARSGRFSPPGREEPRRLLHGRVLQLHQGAARAGGQASERGDAGVPEEPLGARRYRRGDRRAEALLGLLRRERRVAPRLAGTDGPSPPRGGR